MKKFTDYLSTLQENKVSTGRSLQQANIGSEGDEKLKTTSAVKSLVQRALATAIKETGDKSAAVKMVKDTVNLAAAGIESLSSTHSTLISSYKKKEKEAEKAED